MKFVDFLMEPSEERHHKRLDLEEEIMKMEAELEAEQKLNRVLKCALHGPVLCRSCLISFLPHQAQELLVELAMVEEEIMWLERKIGELKLNLCEERELTRQWEVQHIHEKKWRQQQLNHFNRRRNEMELRDLQHYFDSKYNRNFNKGRRASIGSASEMQMAMPREETNERSRNQVEMSRKQTLVQKEIGSENPNKLSEEMIKCLIGIFLTLNKANLPGPSTVPKLTLSCMSSKSFTSKTSFNCKTPTHISGDNTSLFDPYGTLPDLEGSVRDVGPYKNLVHVTRSSLDMRNIATVNVGGIVLNSLAIEHFILRHPNDSRQNPMDEKEMLLRYAYGLGYPEPNVTFALCRGSWSSPALRIYTPDNVVDELETAKVEYLEASIGVTSKKKIMVPKLLQWHMQDFADDIESLLEWIYSQLPHSGLLKRSIMECLTGKTRSVLTKMVEVQPYESEFRYLLPL
ncbi:Ternary complex factor MIP1, leucine-zipper [Dillenia turbinata]|uniref:Ternary complex factor MIP1, leucine-zipper n=1 Tax=Dillenia turbinata TaxID=194707 RepID=A0AAN8V859_9MAGN